jgi:DNA-binding IclR family transcriptional regulator
MAALERGLAVLGALVGERDGLSVGELAGRLGIHQSVASRLLAVLQRAGYLTREPLSGRYRLAFKLAEYGLRHLQSLDLYDYCLPVLRRLAAATGELVRLAMADAEGPVWLAMADGGHNRLRVDPFTGSRPPLHATAAGRAWLATLSEEDAVALALRQRLLPITPKTITTVEGLLADLRKVRQCGYATADEEAEVGVVAIGVALRPAAGMSDAALAGRDETPAIGAVTIAGPTARISVADLERWVPELRATATELARFWHPAIRPLPTGCTGEQRR